MSWSGKRPSRGRHTNAPDPPVCGDGPGLVTTHGVRARHGQLTNAASCRLVRASSVARAPRGASYLPRAHHSRRHSTRPGGRVAEARWGLRLVWTLFRVL